MPQTKPPCKDCPDRAVGCHGYCEKFLEYSKIHMAEIERDNRERYLTNAINNLNYSSALKHENNKEPMKHGRKPKRR